MFMLLECCLNTSFLPFCYRQATAIALQISIMHFITLRKKQEKRQYRVVYGLVEALIAFYYFLFCFPFWHISS